MNNITIGIEGLVGAGKTSLCRELLNLIPNSVLLHGGNLYRGVVYALINSGIDIQKAKDNAKNLDIGQLMNMLKVELKLENRETVIYVDGVEINEENLQSDQMSMAVSTIAKDANAGSFYAFGKSVIDAYKSKYNVIISGRDLMQIYPDLDYHIFITADLETRVDRKMHQYENEKITREEVKKHIEQRDALQEQSGYYKRYEKTIDIDVTDCENAKQSAQKVLDNIKIGI